MGIWVREQNKYTIVECNLINCCRLDGTEHLLQCDSDNRKNVYWGVYSTREKALKVLNMIQECIIDNKANWLHSQYNEPIKNNPEKTFVFQMPQDNEVEV